MNNHTDVIFEAHNDFTPSYEGRENLFCYFPASLPPDKDFINVLITVYDEDADDLQHTLESLGEMTSYTRRKVHVFIIQDGWCRAHSSLKSYVRNILFPTSEDQWDALERFSARSEVSKTYIIQPINAFGELTETLVSFKGKLFLTLVIKTDNRQKHNSQSWFFRSACREYRSNYLFLTDVGSAYHTECMGRLEAFMDKNPGVAGCHGYPWIAPLRPESAWIQHYIRAMQEYELGPLAVDHDRGFQSMFGFQQTLSGPCTFVRTEDATYPSLLRFMASVLERDPSQLNILSSNLNIVEDTAMTLYMFASSGKHMAIVPDAFYYYDVETMPARFMAQRRRWMNGVGCGLLIFWMTYHKILERSVHTRWLQTLVRAIIAVGICSQVILPFIQPALSAFVVYQSFNPNFCGSFQHVLRPYQTNFLAKYDPWLSISATATYLGWFSLWMIYFSRSSKAYQPTLFWITFTLCHTLGLYSYYMVMVVTIQVAYSLLAVWQRCIVAVMIGLHYLSPAITSIIKLDPRTLWSSTIGIIPYMMFFPMWSFIYGYNISRLWDVTWGNRAGMLDKKDAVRNRIAQYRRFSNRLSYNYLVSVAVITTLLCFGSSRYNASYLHAVYVIPWFLLSSLMGAMSIGWTIKYILHKKYTKAIAMFHKPSFQRINRAFTFGADRSKFII